MKIQRVIGLLLVAILLYACEVAIFYLRKLFMSLALEAKEQENEVKYVIFRGLAILTVCISALIAGGIVGVLLTLFKF